MSNSETIFFLIELSTDHKLQRKSCLRKGGVRSAVHLLLHQSGIFRLEKSFLPVCSENLFKHKFPLSNITYVKKYFLICTFLHGLRIQLF